MIDVATAVSTGDRAARAAHPTLQYDVPCRTCGYNLRGLNVAGVCPECGDPVAASGQGDRLAFASPRWLNRLAWGALLYCTGVLLATLGVMILITVLMSYIGFAGWPIYAVWILAAALTVVGNWWLTTPDPSGHGALDYGFSRKFVRVGTVCLAWRVALVLFVNLAGPMHPDVAWPIGWGATVLTLICLATFFGQLNYLRKLVLRIPDQELAGRIRLLAYGFALYIPACLLVGLVGFGVGLQAIVILFALGTILVLFVLYVTMIGGCFATFRRLARRSARALAALEDRRAAAVALERM